MGQVLFMGQWEQRAPQLSSSSREKSWGALFYVVGGSLAGKQQAKELQKPGW